VEHFKKNNKIVSPTMNILKDKMKMVKS